jgi:hypothetical protein
LAIFEQFLTNKSQFSKDIWREKIFVASFKKQDQNFQKPN